MHFSGLSDINYVGNCVFVDEAGFNMRSYNARLVRGTPVLAETKTARAITHLILEAITAHDVISIEIREPLKPKKIKVDGSRKRRKLVEKSLPKGTATGLHMRFISKTLDDMDKFPEMRNFYIVRDNSLIHTSESITSLIEIRHYTAIDLPLVNCQECSQAKCFSRIRRFKTSISETSESVSTKTLYKLLIVPLTMSKNALIENHSSNYLSISQCSRHQLAHFMK